MEVVNRAGRINMERYSVRHATAVMRNGPISVFSLSLVFTLMQRHGYFMRGRFA